MENRFNLIDEPWVPVAGRPRPQSLREVFTDLSLRRLSGNPVDKIVILRLLLSIAHASTKIPDDEAWRRLTPEAISRNALRYLDSVHDSFYLFGDRPFMQFPQLEAQKPKEEKGKDDPLFPGTLQVHVAAGNKLLLTEWNKYHELSDDEIAILILRSSCYSCGGKRFCNKIVLSPEYTGKMNDNGRPSTGTPGTLLGKKKGFLHAYLLGQTLLDTIHLNLMTEQELKALNVFVNGMGKPFWEKMPQGEDDTRAREYCKSYLGELLPLDKFLLYNSNGIIKTDGIHYPDMDRLIDPALTRHSKEKRVCFVEADTDKHPWRELPSLLAFLDAENPAHNLTCFLSCRQKYSDIVHIWTGGMQVTTHTTKEQTISGRNDYVESEFVFPISGLNSNAFVRYRRCMETLDAYARILYSAVNGYYKRLQVAPAQCGSIARKATAAFWERMEPRSQKIVDLTFGEAPETALQAESVLWRQVLVACYDEACPHQTPRQLAAWAASTPNFSPKKDKQKENKTDGK